MQEPKFTSETRNAAFERIVDQALSAPEILTAASRTGAPLTLEQLRAKAVRGRTDIMETAAAHEKRGLMFALAALFLSLGVVAAGVYLMSGFSLHTLDRRPQMGDALATAGLIVAAVAAGASAGNLAWLLNATYRCSGVEGESLTGEDSCARRTRDDGERASLERAVMSFLLRHLDADVRDR
ncbi:hypothetical protein [Streptomyces sp. NPDC001100]